MAAASTNYIPIDVVLGIMARLPVKSLMRLRLISKSSFSLTADSYFITSHLELSKSSGYATLPSNNNANPPPLSISILDKSFSEVRRAEIPFPFSYAFNRILSGHPYRLVGSCNGLLCFADILRGSFFKIIVLWNPMTTKFKSISSTCLNSNDIRHGLVMINLGFWFDGKENDYKIIRIVAPDPMFMMNSSPQAEIYSLKTDSWRKVIFSINSVGEISKFMSSKFMSYRCAMVDGALHWLSCVFRKTVIISFKIEDEQFKVIKLPQDYLRGSNSKGINIMVLKGLLAVSIRRQDQVNGVMVDMWRIWKMNKYDEDDSWTEQNFVIPQTSRRYGWTEDGELIMSQDDFPVCLYNLETGTIKGTNMAPADFVIPFRESLVLL